MRFVLLIGTLMVATVAAAQTPMAPDVAEVVSVDAPVFVLNHVRVIDGTGAPAKEDQAVVIANGKIKSIGPSASVQAPQGAQQMDRTGYTVIPGLVGMHNHLYYTDSISVQYAFGRIGQPGLFIAEIPYTAPRLYLAAGVTDRRGRREAHGGLLDHGRHDLVQSVHEHHQRRIGRGHPGSARAQTEIDRASLFGHLAGSDRAGNR